MPFIHIDSLVIHSPWEAPQTNTFAGMAHFVLNLSRATKKDKLHHPFVNALLVLNDVWGVFYG
jgi:hypothetical protein